jgi:ADP-ribose pyrophosphatase
MSRPGADLAAYERVRETRPDLFTNPPGAAYEIVLESGIQRKAEAGLIYQDQYVMFLRDAVRYRDGTVGTYIRLLAASGNGGAAVLPLLESRIVLIRHFRHATRRWHWEIPRGFAQAGESPEQTARREISEELGTEPDEMIALGAVHPDTGAQGEATQLYLARIASLGELETLEGIDEIQLVSPGEFGNMIQQGKVTDSFTLAAAAYAHARGLLS